MIPIILDEKKSIKKKNPVVWRYVQWFSIWLLWISWLTHDVANIAVFLPRQIDLPLLVIFLLMLIGILFFIFKEGEVKYKKLDILNKYPICSFGYDY